MVKNPSIKPIESGGHCEIHGPFECAGTDPNPPCFACQFDRLGITDQNIAETMPPEGER